MSKYSGAVFKPTLLLSAVLCCNSASFADVVIGKDLNSTSGQNQTINALFSANRGVNPGDQSQQSSDILYGTPQSDVIIGGLGEDVLFGYEGDDILIGGTEDFNGLNRDRAFGGEGNDIFIWAPGDGNDVFHGGPGIDVLIMGLIGESKDGQGNTDDAPFFEVSAPGTTGTGNFDGIELTDSNVPSVDVINGPGFCDIVEQDSQHADSLQSISADHLIRFILRSKRAYFEAGNGTDDGLRVAIHLDDVEFLICAPKEGSGMTIVDLRKVPAEQVDYSQLPSSIQEINFIE